MRAFRRLLVWLLGVAGVTLAAPADPSVARIWNEEALDAIRIDLVRPPVHARNLFHLSVAMYDAWAAYDPVAEGFMVKEKVAPVPTNVAAARAEAISYAAYRVLRHRYARSVNSNTTFAALATRMTQLGYPTNLVAVTGDAPYAVGNRIAATVLTNSWADGANEFVNYRFSFTPANTALVVASSYIVMDDPNRWQPLSLENPVSQIGIPDPSAWQTNVCPHWGRVTPFALMRISTNEVHEDVGPPPQLFSESEDRFMQEMLEVVRFGSWLDPADGVVIDASPGVMGNHPLGTRDGAGHPVNPVTGQPYATNLVRRADYGRVLAEYWADGPDSESPPGHWNSLANAASDLITNKVIAGSTQAVDALEWDVKLYFALNGALHDAAIAAWNHKGVYDGVRPVSAIRWLSATLLMPLEPGLAEIVTAESSAPGQRHAHLATNLNQVALYHWTGQPADPTNEVGGVDWISGTFWFPFQKATFVSPPFAGMISGHSTFSRAAAEVLAGFTGTPFVPGGLGEFVAQPGYLTFEYGPSQETRIQWATYYDAADLAGISRLWGGIHIASDDFGGRKVGARVGRAAMDLARQYFRGEPAPHPVMAARGRVQDDAMVLAWPALTGRVYRVEASVDGVIYAPVSGPITATVASVVWTNPAPPSGLLLHRIVSVP